MLCSFLLVSKRSTRLGALMGERLVSARDKTSIELFQIRPVTSAPNPRVLK